MEDHCVDGVLVLEFPPCLTPGQSVLQLASKSRHRALQRRQQRSHQQTSSAIVLSLEAQPCLGDEMVAVRANNLKTERSTVLPADPPGRKDFRLDVIAGRLESKTQSDQVGAGTTTLEMSHYHSGRSC